ncbi:MAG: hypothetical protein OXC19_17680 [Bryobacterales bacterium]|nr:hypothetical protein [Bryobacterales bacterium]
MHVTLEVECVDRLHLNLYQPLLQTPGGAAHFFRTIRGVPVPSPALMAPITRNFVVAIEAFADASGIDLKWNYKLDLTKPPESPSMVLETSHAKSIS